jgi:UDP-N-acetylglucosamine:LPS N-acetylglucosamine transferase
MAESNLCNVVLQTGKVNPKPYMKKHPKWKIFTLTDKFHEILAGAELVVTHFGSSTILEAVVYQKPIVLVPNPEWIRTTGVEDAKHVAKKVNAVLVSDINSEVLVEAINQARKRKVPTLPNGAEKIAQLIINL